MIVEKCEEMEQKIVGYKENEWDSSEITYVNREFADGWYVHLIDRGSGIIRTDNRQRMVFVIYRKD